MVEETNAHQEEQAAPTSTPTTLYIETNRLTPEGRNLIEEFLKGRYVRRDETINVLLNREQVYYKNAPFFETLYMELNYGECRWRKIRKKQKITQSDRENDARDLAAMEEFPPER